MNGAALAALITAVGAFATAMVGAYVSVKNRQDARKAAEEQAERDDRANALAERTASREELLAIIAAQRGFNETTAAQHKALTEDYARAIARAQACEEAATAAARHAAEQDARIDNLTAQVTRLGGTPT